MSHRLRLLLLSLGVGLVASATPPPRAPAIGPHVGWRAEGLGGATVAAWARSQGATLAGGHTYDYTFGSAPSDWAPAGGVWTVSSRFACDPSWSYFGGWSRGLACLWNKRSFEGDQVVEAYLSFKHGLPFVARDWGELPANLCLTLCGDGQNPASGYSFIYAGENGRRTMIRRDTHVLAETTEPAALGPSQVDRYPDSEQLHWRWWRLQARAFGDGRLEFWIDGAKVLEAVDPAPLRGGQVALWTVRNGMMIARVRLGYEREVRPRVANWPSADALALPESRP